MTNELNLPEGWEVKTLNQISVNLDKIRVPITKKNRIHGSIPYYGASGIVDYVEEHIFDEDLLLVSEDGANLLARTYPIAFSISGKTWVNNHAHVLRFNDKISQRFVELYLNSIKLDNFVSGMAQPKLNQKMLNKIPIHFPPLSEQKRIVAILDETFENITKAKDNVEKNLKNANEIFESYLQSVFGNKGEGWEKKTLGEACEIIMGQSPAGESYNIIGDGVPLINGPVEFGKKSFSKTIKSKFTTKPTKFCKENDLILCVRGSTTGRINIAGFDACIGRGVAAIRYSKNQYWLNYFILSSRQKIYELGTGSTFPNVSTNILKNIIIHLPTLKEQKSIVAKLDALSAETKKLEAIYTQKLADLEELKKSILAKAFNGELTEASV